MSFQAKRIASDMLAPYHQSIIGMLIYTAQCQPLRYGHYAATLRAAHIGTSVRPKLTSARTPPTASAAL